LQHEYGMRRLAQSLVVAGLMIALAGEVMVILDREAGVYQEMASTPSEMLRLAPAPQSMWSAVGTGIAISALGVGCLLLRPMTARLRRRLRAGRRVSHGANLDH
jgi:hypothetical protein